MFGLGDNSQNTNAQQPMAPPAPAMADYTTQSSPSSPAPTSYSVSMPAPTEHYDYPAPDMSQPPPADPQPGNSSTPPPAGISSVNLENAYIPTDPPTAVSDDSSAKPTASSLIQSSTGDDELFKLKQQALQNLAPLVDQLDQSPEEKFKTTMMLIQASDNADLVQEAYEAANNIKDEKARAHALLDVVNEINYFTQNNEAASES